MDKRYWDLFHKGRWVGMTNGADLDEGKVVVKRSLPHVYDEVKYAEWFGRFHPDNCKTSGGNNPDPLP